MYDQQSNYSLDSAQTSIPKNASFAQNIKEQFQNLNERQTKLISAISDKCHDILNRRTPQQEISDPIKESVNDLNEGITQSFFKMRNNTNRLEDILKHLQEII
jgi:phosphoenolpyruvate synthase/pyruvate phosphate dikinase